MSSKRWSDCGPLRYPSSWSASHSTTSSLHANTFSLSIFFRDQVAPVGGDEPIVPVVHAERGTQAADHATGPMWPSLLLIDALDKHVVLRRFCRELRHDLLRPFMHHVGELLVRLRALLVRPDLDLGVELPPEFEVDFSHLEMANKVPRDERVVELFGRVLWLEDDLYEVSCGLRGNWVPERYARTWPPRNRSSVYMPKNGGCLSVKFWPIGKNSLK